MFLLYNKERIHSKRRELQIETSQIGQCSVLELLEVLFILVKVPIPQCKNTPSKNLAIKILLK